MVIAFRPQQLARSVPKKLATLPGIHSIPWTVPFSLLPQTVQLAIAERLSNLIFRQQLANGELCFLETSALRIKISDLDYDWLITLQNAQLCFAPGVDFADTTFTGNSRDFLLLACRREDPDTLFFQRRLAIEGNTELGLQVKNLIDGIDVDELPFLFNQLLSLAADFVEALPAAD